MMAIVSQLNTFAGYVADSMDLTVTWRLADRPLDSRLLSKGEQQRLAGFRLAPRRDSWLRGRAALKPLLATMGMNTDTSNLHLPHPLLSLSHSRDLALAAACAENTRGIGIDLELRPLPRPQTSRLFLTGNELAQWAAAPKASQGALLLKLWCIKEAAFKANPDNHATQVFDYQVNDIFSERGTVCFAGDNSRGRFIAMPLKSTKGQGCVAFVKNG